MKLLYCENDVNVTKYTATQRGDTPLSAVSLHPHKRCSLRGRRHNIYIYMKHPPTKIGAQGGGDAYASSASLSL